MARRTKAERWAEIHAASLAAFNEVQDAQRDERAQCLEDRRFYLISGAAWEGKVGQQFANRPQFEMNKVHLAVIRIISEYRNNKITVEFVPTDGEETDKLADVVASLYRADLSDSNAQEARDNAFEEAVGGGIGAWRLRADYVDEDDDEDDRQKICFEPIYDADTCVFFDIDGRRQDKKDATQCWILSPLSHGAALEQYGIDPTTWPKESQNTGNSASFDWVTPDVVWIAEYYKVEKKPQTILVYRTLDGEEMEYDEEELDDEDDDIERRLNATGAVLVRKETRKKRRVHKYIMCGACVLEDCGLIAGPNIPVVMTYGKRNVVDNIERCAGHVRFSKDAQRLKNMQVSALAEMSSDSSVEKPIVYADELTPEIAEMWANDTVKRYPYLLLKRKLDANGNPVAQQREYTRSPNIPPAMAALLQLTDSDMKDLLGNQEQGEEITPNTSGLAIELIQARLDMQTWIYMDNMRRAEARSAEIWWGMAKELFVEPGRKMKTVESDGKAGSVQLRRPVLDETTGSTTYENDLKNARFEVVANIGPPSASKRSAVVRNLLGILRVTTDPEDQKVLVAMILMNLEGEGLSDLRTFYRNKLVRMGVVQPTPEEAAKLQQEQANAKPDPNAEFIIASAEEARAKAELTKAKIDNTNADTAVKLNDMEQGNLDAIQATFQYLDQQELAEKEHALAAQEVAQNANRPA